MISLSNRSPTSRDHRSRINDNPLLLLQPRRIKRFLSRATLVQNARLAYGGGLRWYKKKKKEGREEGTRRVQSKDDEEGRKEYGIFKGDARVEGRGKESVAEWIKEEKEDLLPGAEWGCGSCVLRVEQWAGMEIIRVNGAFENLPRILGTWR